MTQLNTRIAVISLLLAAAILVGIFFKQRVEPTVLRTHTTFLLAQLNHSYCDSFASGHVPVESEKAFLDLIPQWSIDWNSCQFRNGIIFDSWSTAMKIHVDAASIYLRSAGPDRCFNTPDDIEVRFPNHNRTPLPAHSDR
ncbi:MAG: hypothetical protein WCV00_20235 [Verrucomicrobiia bacterium]|jgi:hypothetical protein